jgi:hypothetical protein
MNATRQQAASQTKSPVGELPGTDAVGELG